MDTAESLCPHVMRKPNLRHELIKAGTGKMTVPRSFVKNTLLEQSGIDIINKIRSETRSRKFLKTCQMSYLRDVPWSRKLNQKPRDYSQWWLLVLIRTVLTSAPDPFEGVR